MLFFWCDTVSHDKLMKLLSETIKDGRVLSLIRFVLAILKPLHIAKTIAIIIFLSFRDSPL